METTQYVGSSSNSSSTNIKNPNASVSQRLEPELVRFTNVQGVIQVGNKMQRFLQDVQSNGSVTLGSDTQWICFSRIKTPMDQFLQGQKTYQSAPRSEPQLIGFLKVKTPNDRFLQGQKTNESFSPRSEIQCVGSSVSETQLIGFSKVSLLSTEIVKFPGIRRI